MTFDPSGDWEIFDGIETVTLTSRTTSGETTSEVPTTVAGAFRESANAQDLQFSGAVGLGVESVVFHLAWENLSGVVPKRMDAIIDVNGVQFEIVNVTYDTLIKNYRCVCNRRG